ncbi:MAG: 50S ribosomal protein L6 [Planctomycetes bacterium]|nr:50S ribosomal protein L6 [Planctomycetota bacterium]
MSRIGKKPIPLPPGVQVERQERTVTVKGPKGSLRLTLLREVEVEHDAPGKRLLVTRLGDTKNHRARHGLTRALLNNMVTGVTAGFAKTLDIEGVGYNARVDGKRLLLTVGYTHPVELDVPEGLTVKTPAPTEISVSGADRQMVGQFAAVVRRVRPPEPYKGKGIRYRGEVIRRKAGKTFVGGATK